MPEYKETNSEYYMKTLAPKSDKEKKKREHVENDDDDIEMSLIYKMKSESIPS